MPNAIVSYTSIGCTPKDWIDSDEKFSYEYHLLTGDDGYEDQSATMKFIIKRLKNKYSVDSLSRKGLSAMKGEDAIVANSVLRACEFNGEAYDLSMAIVLLRKTVELRVTELCYAGQFDAMESSELAVAEHYSMGGGRLPRKAIKLEEEKNGILDYPLVKEVTLGSEERQKCARMVKSVDDTYEFCDDLLGICHRKAARINASASSSSSQRESLYQAFEKMLVDKKRNRTFFGEPLSRAHGEYVKVWGYQTMTLVYEAHALLVSPKSAVFEGNFQDMERYNDEVMSFL